MELKTKCTTKITRKNGENERKKIKQNDKEQIKNIER